MNLLQGFNGIRAIAILMVMLHHLFLRMNPAEINGVSSFINNLGIMGDLGVSLFFVLSGALLSVPFWDKYFNNEVLPSIKQYCKRRFFRIAPAYYLCMIVSLLISIYFFNRDLDVNTVIRFISGITFTNSMHYLTLFPTHINGPLWSIGFEVISYLLLLLVMLFMFRFIKDRQYTSAFYFMLLVLSMVVLTHVLIVKFFPVLNNGVAWNDEFVNLALRWVPKYNPISLFSIFLFGIFAGGIIAYLKKHDQKKHIKFDWLIVITLSLTIVPILLMNLYVVILDRPFIFGSQDVFFNIPYLWPIIPAVVAVLLLSLPFSLKLGKFIDNKFFNFTAKISFGLYLWHTLVLELIIKYYFPQYSVFEGDNMSTLMWLGFWVFLGSYIVASLSFYLLESPIQQWSQKTKLARGAISSRAVPREQSIEQSIGDKLLENDFKQTFILKPNK
ncbi:MAG: acyltransferase [Saccharospirillaceae bacterium]|nr:acyltransferase [Pseudomonadales bacterium]NRB79414.1 acyltransferase [Saccharospirillaceae bacterium]